MFKILVDGVWYGPWDEKECDYITIGSAADAHVRLEWADDKHLTIWPMCDKDFLVEINGDNSIVVPKLLSEGLVWRFRDPNCAGGGKFLVYSGNPMNFMGHTIRAFNILKRHPFGEECRQCGVRRDAAVYVRSFVSAYRA
jgi:hypothetical protein